MKGNSHDNVGKHCLPDAVCSEGGFLGRRRGPSEVVGTCPQAASGHMAGTRPQSWLLSHCSLTFHLDHWEDGTLDLILCLFFIIYLFTQFSIDMLIFLIDLLSILYISRILFSLTHSLLLRIAQKCYSQYFYHQYFSLFVLLNYQHLRCLPLVLVTLL